jgi:quercetin dioxygenase-like cupin family protein
VIVSRNADVDPVAVNRIEGEPVLGGALFVKPLIEGDRMTLLETRVARGVAAPAHVHAHESLLYVVEGRVKTVVGAEEYIVGRGDACRHPAGVLHRVVALDDSIIVEVKSPAPELRSLFGFEGAS